MEKGKKVQLQRELEAIFGVLEDFPEGAGIENIRQSIGLPIELRTLQRRLALLVNEGKIRSEGSTNNTRYFLVKTEKVDAIISSALQTDDGLTLSKKSEALLAAMRLPSSQRKAVGYNLSFLESYQPNISFYLSPTERKSLAQTGKTTTGEQPAGTYARQILNRLLIDLSWNSSRLEGNTYSLLDTQRLLAEGQAAPEKSAKETQMILNHKDAIEFLVQDAGEDIGFYRYAIQSLHALLSHNLLGDPAASGRLRTFGVGITGSVYTPLAIPQQLEEVFDAFLQKAEAIEDPFEQAFFAMVHLPYLQPFDDVNKRVSRLAANIPLNKYNLSPLSFTDVPQDLYVAGLLGIYEQNNVSLLKDVFFYAYGRSAAKYAAIRQTLGEPDPFRLRYREQIKKTVRQIIVDAVLKSRASLHISKGAEGLPTADRQRFNEAVEIELMSLHEGNFARYGVTPSQYKAWKEVWDK